MVLFHSVDEILVMVHGAIKATALHEETIWLHMSLPLTTHVRAYVAVRDGHPSGTHSLTPDREEVPQQSSSNPQPDGRTSCQYQMDLRDLGDAQLSQLIGDLHQEVALRE